MNHSVETEKSTVDVDKYVEILYLYRCRICNDTLSSTNEIRQHVLSNHFKETPTGGLILAEDFDDKNASLELSAYSDNEDAVESNDHCEDSEASENPFDGDYEPVADKHHTKSTSGTGKRGKNFKEPEKKQKNVKIGPKSRMFSRNQERKIQTQSSLDDVEMKPTGIVATSSKKVNTTMTKTGKTQRGEARRAVKLGEARPAVKLEVQNEQKPSVVQLPKIIPEIVIPVVSLDFVCSFEYCSARFAKPESLEFHRQCHNASTSSSTSGPSLFERMSRCPECFELSPTWNTLLLHLWAQHEIDVELLRCPTCEYRTDTAPKLTAHLMGHSAEKPFCCRVCGTGFESEEKCVEHVNENHRKGNGSGSQADGGDKFGSKLCEICGRNFATHQCLKSHIQHVHNKAKPYLCPVCGHPSARKAMMLSHLRTHTGEKPYRCNMCNYNASDHNTLRRHKQRHTGDTSYKCIHCDYTCIQSISLKSHFKRNHPEANNRYTCDECRYSTVNRQNWLAHEEEHIRNGVRASDAAAVVNFGMNPTYY